MTEEVIPTTLRAGSWLLSWSRLVAVVMIHVCVVGGSWMLILADAVVQVLIVWYVYCEWLKNMGEVNGKYTRSDPRCPSWPPGIHKEARKGSVTTGLDCTTENDLWLNMCHVHIPFLPFLAAHYFILPNAMFLWTTEIVKLLVRQCQVHERVPQPHQ